MHNFILLTTSAPAATGGATGTPAAGPSPLIFIAEIAFLGIVLYFLMIRPQKKRQKQMSAMLSTVSAGDSVLTAGGFYGVVIDVMDEIVIVEFGNNKNCRIPMKKSSIAEIEKPNTTKE